MRRVFAGRLWPAEWEDAATSAMGITFLTAEETEQVAQEMLRVLARFRHRSDDPESRPAGSLPVEFGVFTYPLADMAVLAGQGKPEPDAGAHPGPGSASGCGEDKTQDIS